MIWCFLKAGLISLAPALAAISAAAQPNGEAVLGSDVYPQTLEDIQLPDLLDQLHGGSTPGALWFPGWDHEPQVVQDVQLQDLLGQLHGSSAPGALWFPGADQLQAPINESAVLGILESLEYRSIVDHDGGTSDSFEVLQRYFEERYPTVSITHELRRFDDPSFSQPQQVSTQTISFDRLREISEALGIDLSEDSRIDWIVTMQQVLPGIELPDSNFVGIACDDVYCGVDPPAGSSGSGADTGIFTIDGTPVFPERISYAATAHDEVLLLQHRSSTATPWTPHCSSVAISSRFVLTAMHCIAASTTMLTDNFTIQPSAVSSWRRGESTGPMRFRAISSTGQPLAVIRAYVPLLDGRIQQYGGGRTGDLIRPRVDLALLEIEPLPYSPDVSALGASTLDFGDVLTFAGYGMTENDTPEQTSWARYAAFNVLRGRYPDHFTSVNGELGAGYLGGPCRGDSGGPVFHGYERGYSDDQNTIVGIVSYLRPSHLRQRNPGEQVIGEDCLGGEVFSVRLDRHVDEICLLSAREPGFC